MASCTGTVVRAESMSESMFSKWGSLLRLGIDDLAGRLCPVNLWQEAREALVRRKRHSGSLETRRGGHVGSSAGRPATDTSSRSQTGKILSACESRRSRLCMDSFRMLESVLGQKL
jgi:hypothetical protein